ncbi:ATP-binding protein [Salinibacter ruber]|uniref:ATP-binding protein n=1 Tax=Salinibacter ruber TaxID=146919 RepID=UPI0024523D61|nr:signal transduction histidine kinase [Salinibacter ruber]
MVEVEDTGIGMDADTVEHVFEPFRQASEGLNREYEGTGLGLAVTKQVIEKMNGDIEVDTEEDAGTCVRLRLPRAASEADAGSSPVDEQ